MEPRPAAGPGGSIRSGYRCLVALVFDRRAFSDLAADRLLRSVADSLLGLRSATAV
jgi:hypothetical protein